MRRDWSGRSLLVTAGPTVEALDPARIVSNRSSGRMGVMLAQAARWRGARVELIHGPLQLPDAWLEGLSCHPVESAQAMESALIDLQPGVDAVAMAAAVADLRRRGGALAEKPAKATLTSVLSAEMEPVPDLLVGLAERLPPVKCSWDLRLSVVKLIRCWSGHVTNSLRNNATSCSPTPLISPIRVLVPI